MIPKYLLTKDSIKLNEIDTIIQDISYNFKNFTFDENTLTIYTNGKKIILNLKYIPHIELEKIEEEKEKEKIKEVEHIIDPTKPVIALTFDDGPTKYTEQILEILRKENANATFFVLGNRVVPFKDTLNQLIIQGSEIGNHSYNHKWLSRLSEEEIKEQIEKTQEIIKETTGVYPRYLRPTYGAINSKIRKCSNLNIILWDIDPKDWKNISPETIVERIEKKVEDGKVILLHDNHKRTVEAIKILIPKLKKEGYQFVTLSEMEEIYLLKGQTYE